MTDTMRLRIGGKLDVLRLGFGAICITGPGIWGQPEDRDEAIRTLERVVELGVDLIAEALSPYPDNLIIETKGAWFAPGRGSGSRSADPNTCTRASRFRCAARGWTASTSTSSTGPTARCQSATAWGSCTSCSKPARSASSVCPSFSPEQLAEAKTMVDPVTAQNRYNVADRSQEAVLDICERDGITFLPWAPVASGRMARSGGPPGTLAVEHGASMAQLCIAWLLRRSPTMLPIPGTSNVAHLEQNVAAARLDIPAEAWDKLEQYAQAHLT